TVLLYLQGQLAAAPAADVERHLDECAECSAFLAEVGRTISAGDLPAAAPSTGGGAAASAGEAAPLARSTTVGRYIILNPIGAGGMGVVYAAYDAELDRTIALKLLRPAPAATARADEIRARLLREAQALARLQHPNVVAVHDAGTFHDEVFVAMELVDGETLTRWLRARRRTWREVIAVFVQAGTGLAAAHSAGLVHRDFKPDNVLVGKDGRARVADFGLARPASAAPEATLTAPAPPDERPRALTRTGARLGTPAYMAPEQHRGEAADARSDQFSFCVALYEALYGERPCGDDGGVRRRGEPRDSPRDRRVPARLRRVVRRGLSGAPAARYPSMEALLAALGRNPRARRLQQAAALTLAALLAAGALGYRTHAERTRRQCQDAVARLRGVWDEPRRAAGQAAFRATGAPGAEDAWARVRDELDRYTAAWVADRTGTCEATRRGPQAAEAAALRLECLDWRLEEVRALGTLLEHADAAIVDRATLVARRLTPIINCGSTTLLTRRPRPPRDPALRARVDAIRVQITEAMILYYAGKLREAEGGARQAAASARASGHRAIEAEALRALGQLLISTDKQEESEAVLRQAVTAAEASGHDEAKAEALVQLVWVLSMSPARSPARLREAEQSGQLAAATIERLGGDVPRLEAVLAHNLGVLAWARGRFAEAQQHLERGLRALEREPDGPAIAPMLQGLGLVLAGQGQLAAAAPILEQAIARRERDFGPGHPRVARYLIALVEVRTAQGRPDEALALAQRALALTRSGSTRDSLLTGEALGAVGACRAAQGRDVDALALAQETLAVTEKALGPRDPRLAQRRSALADALRRTGQLAAALAEHRRALTLLEGTVEPEHPDRARALHGIGATLLAQRRPAEALAPLERALAIREHAAIPPADLAATRFALAQALAGAGRDRERARALAVEARAGLAHAEGPHEAARAAIDRWLARAVR
ncbi:MAG TPA: serine/threonine-protein kinase, partial [Polyangia bacterium]